jgi:isocitrate dehydrogenase (NAD+)
MTTPVTIIKGDGVGAEVVEAALVVLDSTGVDFEWEIADAGAAANIKVGDALPDETVRSIRRTRICLKGPLEAPEGPGNRSADARLKSELELHTNLRPLRSYPGPKVAVRDIDLVVVRENMDGELAPFERYLDHDGEVVQSVSSTTRAAWERIIQCALDFALRTHRKVVTLVHGGNTLRLTSEVIVRAGCDLARYYGGIRFEVMAASEAAVNLVTSPARFDVVVTTTAFGYTLSDVAAGLLGSLELVPEMNAGDDAVVFGPAHGTAPDLAGKGLANPTATILAGAVMLRHLGEASSADLIDSTVRTVLAEGKHVTADLGGRASTAEFGQHVAGIVRRLRSDGTSTR